MPTLNPPPVIANDLGLVSMPLQYLATGHTSLITWALNCGANDLATAQDAVDDLQANFTTQFQASLDSGISYGPATIKLGSGTTTPVEAVAAIGAQAGTGSVTFGVASNAILIKKTTGLGGKANRGRTYFPYLLPTSHIVEPGLIDSTELPALQTHFTAFLGQLTTDSTPMVIANKVFNVPLAPHYVTHINMGPAVTAYTVEQTLATQRRRLRP